MSVTSLSSVLVVEDDPFISVGLEMALHDAGYVSIRTANSYVDALLAIDDSEFNLCILDLNLRNSGPDVAHKEPEGRRLLSLLKSRNVSTVVYSGVLNQQVKLKDIYPSIITMDKTEAIENVISALERMDTD